MIFFDFMVGLFILMFLIFFVCAVVIIPVAIVSLFGIYGFPAVIMAFVILYVIFCLW